MVVTGLLEPGRNPASVRHRITVLLEPFSHGAGLALVGPSGCRRLAAVAWAYLAGMCHEFRRGCCGAGWRCGLIRQSRIRRRRERSGKSAWHPSRQCHALPSRSWWPYCSHLSRTKDGFCNATLRTYGRSGHEFALSQRRRKRQVSLIMGWDRGEWWGRVRALDGHHVWISARDLRKMPSNRRPARSWLPCCRRTGRNVPPRVKRPLMPMSGCRPGWPVVPPGVTAWLGFGG
jgi:hypothetical protein